MTKGRGRLGESVTNKPKLRRVGTPEVIMIIIWTAVSRPRRRRGPGWLAEFQRGTRFNKTKNNYYVSVG